jgi:DNA repair protein RecO (recombination protein O)
MTVMSAEALILDVTDLHDRDRVVTFLTREHGKRKGVAKGARVKHSRFGGQLQPLAKAQVAWFEKEGRELVRLSSVELLRTAHPLQTDLEGILLGSYLADHLLEFAQEGEASDHLYRLLDATIEALLRGVDRDLAARYFEAWVLRAAVRRDAALPGVRRRERLHRLARGAGVSAPHRPRKPAGGGRAGAPAGGAAAGGGPLRAGAAALPSA